MKKKQLTPALALLVITITVGGAVAAYIASKNTPAQTGTWQLYNQVSGVGTDATTEFTMNSSWRTLWTVKNPPYNLFIVTAYLNVGGKYSPIAEEDGSDTNATQGILQVNSTGSFVVRVVAMSATEWSLRIEKFIGT